MVALGVQTATLQTFITAPSQRCVTLKGVASCTRNAQRGATSDVRGRGRAAFAVAAAAHVTRSWSGGRARRHAYSSSTASQVDRPQVWARTDWFTLALQRFGIPSALCGVAAAVLFCPCSLAVRSFLAETTRDVLKDDISQYTQNAFGVVTLLFGLLLGTTLSILLQRQERLYRALYNEMSEARALMEQLSMLGAGRQVYAGDFAGGELLDSMEEYLLEDLQLLGGPSVLPSRGGLSADPLERLLFETSVGVPSGICGSVRSIRQARAERLAAAQRKYPGGHVIIIGMLGTLVLSAFILLGSGMTSFEAFGQADQSGHLLSGIALWHTSRPEAGTAGSTLRISGRCVGPHSAGDGRAFRTSRYRPLLCPGYFGAVLAGPLG
ncbi:unnamed protein product [Polarella glacialis]|uniref:Uncharacterized protein n=1 Tax=Polarella glacialis TaxID=89957 RepID=A0A813IJK1_POLGL|nr:unnamed protein product [Polarella glacialis]